MKKYIFAILISVFLSYPLQGFAEVKEIISEGVNEMALRFQKLAGIKKPVEPKK